MARLAAAGLLLAAALALAHGAVALDDWAASGLAGNISGVSGDAGDAGQARAATAFPQASGGCRAQEAHALRTLL